MLLRSFRGEGQAHTSKVVDALYWRAATGAAIAESDGSGNVLSEYVFFGGERIARRDGSGNVYFYYTDQVGSTVAMTDASGNPCYEATFTPYGEEHATQNSCPQNYKFTGYERDAETGLDYAFARYYNSRLGRFMSADPMGLGSADASDPQSLDAYAYVRNSPTGLTDPTGMEDNGIQPYGEAHCFTAGWPDEGFDPGSCGYCGAGWGGIVQSVGIPVTPGMLWICTGNTDILSAAEIQAALSRQCSQQNPCTGTSGNNSPTAPTGKGPTKCAQPNWLNKLEIPLLHAWASDHGETVGIGINISAAAGAGLGVTAGGSGFLVVSPSGQAAFVFSVPNTVGPPAGPLAVVSPGAGVYAGAAFLQSGAASPQQLSGTSVNFGVGGGDGLAAGGDISVGQGGVVTTVVTVGFGAGGAGHAFSIQTATVTPVCGY